MTDANGKLPIWFWVIAGLALVWNAIGVMSFIGMNTMDAAALAEMSAAERALYENTPMLTTVAFAVAVFGGLAGSILLLLRKNLAMTAFIASLIGIVIQFSYWLFMSGANEVYDPGHLYMMPAMVTVIGIFLLWFTNMAKAKGWLS